MSAYDEGRSKARGVMRAHGTRFVSCSDVHSVAYRVGARIYGDNTPDAVEYANGWTCAVIAHHEASGTTCGQCSTGEGCCADAFEARNGGDK